VIHTVANFFELLMHYFVNFNSPKFNTIKIVFTHCMRLADSENNHFYRLILIIGLLLILLLLLLLYIILLLLKLFGFPKPQFECDMNFTS